MRAEVGYLAPMDGLRGIAVLWVVLFHYRALRPDIGDPWVSAVDASDFVRAIVGSGYLGVDLFFLISGFLLAMPWFVHAREHRPPPSVREFYARRFWRIAPAYYVQLAILFVVVMPLIAGASYWRRDLYVYIYNAFAHAAFIHNLLPISAASMNANGALWTLAIEMQFYLLLPLIVPLLVRAPRRWLAAAVLASMAWRAAAAYDLDVVIAACLRLGAHWNWQEAVIRHLLVHMLPSYFGHFALGILMGGTWLSWRAHGAPNKATLDVAAAIALAVLYFHMAILGDLLGKQSWLLPTAALAVLLMWCVSRPGAFASRVLGRGPLAALGRISYSAYLYHVPLILLWNGYAVALPGWASVPLYLASLIAVSWLSWRWIEQPFLHGIASRR